MASCVKKKHCFIRRNLTKWARSVTYVHCSCMKVTCKWMAWFCVIVLTEPGLSCLTHTRTSYKRTQLHVMFPTNLGKLNSGQVKKSFLLLVWLMIYVWLRLSSVWLLYICLAGHHIYFKIFELLFKGCIVILRNSGIEFHTLWLSFQLLCPECNGYHSLTRPKLHLFKKNV